MKRRLLTLAVESLVLCVASFAMLVRSYVREDIVTLERASGEAQQRR